MPFCAESSNCGLSRSIRLLDYSLSSPFAFVAAILDDLCALAAIVKADAPILIPTIDFAVRFFARRAFRRSGSPERRRR